MSLTRDTEDMALFLKEREKKRESVSFLMHIAELCWCFVSFKLFTWVCTLFLVFTIKLILPLILSIGQKLILSIGQKSSTFDTVYWTEIIHFPNKDRKGSFLPFIKLSFYLVSMLLLFLIIALNLVWLVFSHKFQPGLEI